MNEKEEGGRPAVPATRRGINAEITAINQELQAMTLKRKTLRSRIVELETASSNLSSKTTARLDEEGSEATLPVTPKRAAAARLSGLDIRVTTRCETSIMPAMMPEKPSIARTCPTEPGVTDHAVVRYMERVMGFDLDDVRRRILTPAVAAALRTGATRIRTAEGCLVAKEALVTSFLPHDGPKRRRNRPVPESSFRRSDSGHRPRTRPMG